MAELRFGVNLNLEGNEVINIVVENLASDPTEKTAGRFIYNTTSKSFKYCDGTSWLAVGTGGVSGIQKHIENVGDGAATGYTITHNLNTEDITVSLYEGKKTVFSEVEILDENSIKVSFSKALAINAVKVVIIG